MRSHTELLTAAKTCIETLAPFTPAERDIVSNFVSAYFGEAQKKKPFDIAKVLAAIGPALAAAATAIAEDSEGSVTFTVSPEGEASEATPGTN